MGWFRRFLALAIVIVAVLAAVGGGALSRARSGGPEATSTQRAALTGQATGTAPLRVISVSPAAGARGVDGGDPVVVTFSAPLAPGSPLPRLRPAAGPHPGAAAGQAIPGSWQPAGASLTFQPAVPLSPSSWFTLRIPGGPAGVRSASGAMLARSQVASFRTGAWSTRRLSELLAQLGYLPLSWHPFTARGRQPAGPGPAAQGLAAGGQAAQDLAAQAAEAYSPPAGTFRWHRGYPGSLHAEWRAGGPNLVLTGAVMAFESQHGMTMNGVAGPSVWHAIFRALAGGQRNPDGYTYALASKVIPETLTIWHDGRIVLSTPANTGIPVAPTADGTFPVYLRYRFQIMQGINPDGSSYADPVSFVSYFDGGEAVHYFPRGSYGFPQSLGCVELPLGAAAAAWPYLTYGSLVTVAG